MIWAKKEKGPDLSRIDRVLLPENLSLNAIDAWQKFNGNSEMLKLMTICADSATQRNPIEQRDIDQLNEALREAQGNNSKIPSITLSELDFTQPPSTFGPRR